MSIIFFLFSFPSLSLTRSLDQVKVAAIVTIVGDTGIPRFVVSPSKSHHIELYPASVLRAVHDEIEYRLWQRGVINETKVQISEEGKLRFSDKLQKEMIAAIEANRSQTPCFSAKNDEYTISPHGYTFVEFAFRRLGNCTLPEECAHVPHHELLRDFRCSYLHLAHAHFSGGYGLYLCSKQIEGKLDLFLEEYYHNMTLRSLNGSVEEADDQTDEKPTFTEMDNEAIGGFVRRSTFLASEGYRRAASARAKKESRILQPSSTGMPKFRGHSVRHVWLFFLVAKNMEPLTIFYRRLNCGF